MNLTTEQINRMMVFHNNEVSPRIKRNLIPPIIDNQEEWDKFWEKYFEAVLFGADMFKLKEYGKINNIKARELLDKEIGNKYDMAKTQK